MSVGKGSTVKLSLVIPTRNRCQALALTLEHLSRQTLSSQDFEVWVVDDGSQDDTLQVLHQFEGQLPLKWLQQDHRGTSVARNRAIGVAQGQHILFVDDDVMVPGQFLQRHLTLLEKNPGCLIRGPVVNVEAPLPHPLPSLWLAWRHFSKNYLCTSNASIERHLLLRAGLFDPSFRRWEDAELGVRLKRLGVRRVFDNQTYVYHWKPRPSLEQAQQTAALDGQAAAQLYLRYPNLRMWLRSGLHIANRCKNSVLRNPTLPLPQNLRNRLELERVYLKAGHEELRNSR